MCSVPAIVFSHQEFSFEEGSENELGNDLRHGDHRQAACWQAAHPLPWGNNDLGPLSPFQKVQPGREHSHHHVHASCV